MVNVIIMYFYLIHEHYLVYYTGNHLMKVIFVVRKV